MERASRYRSPPHPSRTRICSRYSARTRGAHRDIRQWHDRARTDLAIDQKNRRVVWSADGGSLTHHNASAQVFANAKGETTVVWIADLLPDEAAATMAAMMEQGMAVMKQTLDQLV